MKITDRVVIITGGARGIGKNIAQKFGRMGDQVIICDLDEGVGDIIISNFKEHGLNVDFFPVDLSQKGTPQRMIQQVANKYGKIDILVNNARSGDKTSLFEETENTWDKTLSVTLKGAFFASQEAIQHMSEKRKGVIINIGSVVANYACDQSPSYHIAKAGVTQMTRYLALQAGRYNIRVNCVVPGFIVKDEHKDRFEDEKNIQYRKIAELSHPIGHIGSSDDVADAVIFLCSPQATFITGQELVVDGGLTIQEQSCLLYKYNSQK